MIHSANDFNEKGEFRDPPKERYTVVVENVGCLDTFKVKVNSLLARGWKLHGPPLLTDVTLLQAMVEEIGLTTNGAAG